jgi:anti-sigma factor RsiW
MMRCHEVEARLERLADSALPALSRWFVERHLTSCPACAARLAALTGLRAAMRTGLARHRAPPALAARLGTALAAESPAEPPNRQLRSLRLAGWFSGALAGAALASLAMFFMLPRAPSGAAEAALGVIDGHVRALMENHLIDVASSDRHTVKPWLSARLDLSPPVHDLAAEGFPLVGGRLDYVDGHRAAALVYRADRHVINLFVWAAAGAAAAPSVEAVRGFNLVRWRGAGMQFWAVSDLEPARLLAFARQVAAGE